MLSSASETPQPVEPSGSSEPIYKIDLKKRNYGSKINGAVLDFKDAEKLKESYANACPIEYADDFLNALKDLESKTTSEMSGDQNPIQTMMNTNNNCKKIWVEVLYKHYFKHREGFEKMHNAKLEELKKEFGDKFDDDVLKSMAYNNCFPEIRFKLPESGILYFKDYGVIASVEDALRNDRDFTSFYQGQLQKTLHEIFQDDDERRLQASKSSKEMQSKIQSDFEQKLTMKLNALMTSFLNGHFQEWRKQQGALIEYTSLFDQTTHPMLQGANRNLAGNRHFDIYPSELNISSGAYDIVVTRMWSEIRKIYDELKLSKGQTSKVESIIPQQHQDEVDWNTYCEEVIKVSQMFNYKKLQTPKARFWDGYDIADLEYRYRNNCLINRVFCMHYAWINAYRNLRVIELLCRRPTYKDKFAKRQKSSQSEGQGNDAGDVLGMEEEELQNQIEARGQMLKRGRAFIEQCVANDVFRLDQTEQEAREKAKEAYIQAKTQGANEKTLYELLKKFAGGDPLAMASLGIGGYGKDDDAPKKKKTKKQKRAEKQEEKERKAELRLGRGSYSAREKRHKRKMPSVRREKGKKKPDKYYENYQIQKIATQARDFQKLLAYYYIDSDNFEELFETIPVMDSDDTLTEEETFMLHNDLKQILHDVLFYIFNGQSGQRKQEIMETAALFKQYCHSKNIPFWAEMKEVSNQYSRFLKQDQQEDEEEEAQRVAEAMFYLKGTTAIAREGPV